jgi:FixJ family two-component response regulator
LPSVIHIVDDDASFRKSVAQLLQLSGYDVALYDSAEDLLRAAPDAGLGCILLDVRMPGLSGPELQERLAQLQSPLPIIFLSGHGNIPTTVKAIKAGAEDFLAKPVAKEHLLEAIRRALERCQAVLAERDQLGTLQARLGKLTPRERRVFAAVARGQLNKQIAFALGTSERTIKAHRQKVMHKLNAQSLLELAAMAERLGILGAEAPAVGSRVIPSSD